MGNGYAIRVAAVVALVASLALPLAGNAGATPPEMIDVIVVLHEGVDARSTAHEMARSHDARVGHIYEYALSGFAAQVPEGRLQGLERDARVAYVDENRTVHAVEYPTGVRRVDADDAHSLATPARGAGVRVAVIDTGIDLDHPDLAVNIEAALGVDCITPGTSADDDQGHGTHVAGTIAAKSGGTVVGVAPAATLVPIKVLDSSGSGSWSDVICGIDHVTQLNTVTSTPVDVANMSLGGSGSHDGSLCGGTIGGFPSASMFQAICSAIASGSAFTVAAGNDSRDASGFVPAAYPDVITVSAYSDTNGEADGVTTCSGRGPWKTCDEAFASFSNYGSIVDVIAPGVSILSTTVGGGTGTKSGTSMAAPHVAGVAALALEANPGLTPGELSAHLQATGQCPDQAINGGPGYCDQQGTWNSDPDSPATEPMANALWAATTSTGGGDGGGDTNTAPTASFTPACTDLSCTFDGSASSDADGTINDYAWSFGDGSTASGATASHTYATGGTFMVTLTVTDDGGKTGSTSQNVTVTAPDSSGLTLSASGYKVKGVQHADLSWTSSVATSVYRNGASITTVSGGSYTDVIGARGGGSYTYKVCNSEGCSNEVTVTF